MLIGVDPLLGPELLHVLALMGHGDEIAVVDANFPANSVAPATIHGRVVTVSGTSTPEVAGAILTLLPLDDAVSCAVRVMAAGGTQVQPVHRDLQKKVEEAAGTAYPLEGLERFAFYEACRHSYAVVQTGELRLFGNALIRKGVVKPLGQ